MTSITLKFELTEEVFVRGNGEYQRKVRRYPRVKFIAMTLLGAGFLYWFFSSSGRLKDVHWVFLLIGCVLISVLVVLYKTHEESLEERYKKLPEEKRGATYWFRITEEGIEASGPGIQQKTDWNQWKHYLETEHHLYLWNSSGLINMIPKSACESPSDIHALISLVQTKLPKAIV